MATKIFAATWGDLLDQYEGMPRTTPLVMQDGADPTLMVPMDTTVGDVLIQNDGSVQRDWGVPEQKGSRVKAIIIE